MSDESITHIIIDFETLGINPDSAVLSFACVPFTFEEPKTFAEYVESGFYVKFDIPHQMKLGRKIDQNTVNWWKKQGADAKKILFPSDYDYLLLDGMNSFIRFVRSSGYNKKKSYAWSRGQDFDFPILESILEQVNLDSPFNNWKYRDIRTYIDVLSGSDDGQYTLKTGTPEGFVKHDCLHDCAYDACKMVEIYQELLANG